MMVKSTSIPSLSMSIAAAQQVERRQAMALGLLVLLFVGVLTGVFSLESRATNWLVPLIVAPAVEELFFRGVIQEALLSFGFQPLMAVLLVSIVFAAAHLWNSSAGHALATSVPALVVGLVYQYYRRFGLVVATVSAILLHSVFNAMWQLKLAKVFSQYLAPLI